MILSKRALFEERYPLYGIGYDPLTKVNKERNIQCTALVMIHSQRSTKSVISNVRHWLRYTHKGQQSAIYPMYSIGYDTLTKVNKGRYIQCTALVMTHSHRSTKSDISNV